MPYVTPSAERISHLINTYGEGGYEAAQITEKSDAHFYETELAEIGRLFLMDDFGDAHPVTWDLFRQYAYIYPPVGVVLT